MQWRPQLAFGEPRTLIAGIVFARIALKAIRFRASREIPQKQRRAAFSPYAAFRFKAPASPLCGLAGASCTALLNIYLCSRFIILNANVFSVTSGFL